MDDRSGANATRPAGVRDSLPATPLLLMSPMLASVSAVWSVVLTLLLVLGSLGVFLYGMKVMSEAVQKVAGDRMRQALAGLTDRRLNGVATGFVTTVLVQSSSATTVLVVSFVNAGLLTLIQSIGVIMGANLGTTVTAWIVAMIGKFNVSAVALPVIGIGMPFLFIGRDRGRNWGQVLIGFGLIFFGLGLLKDSVPDLRLMMETDPDTAEAIGRVVTAMSGHGFGSVLLFLVAGVLLTLAVQSSSAAMAITLTCALNGWLGDIHTDPVAVFRNSAAIVLGENIGTTLTAWLASLGANANAKRAARAHFLFNIFGVLWMLAAFHLFTALVWQLALSLPGGMRSVDPAFQVSEVGFATAIFHSLFNLVNILVLIAFVPHIARVVERWVKDDPDSVPGGAGRLQYLTPPLVNIGELSLAEADNAARRMGRLTADMFDGFVEVLESPGEDKSERVNELRAMEDECDEMLHDITAYLIQCSTHQIEAGHAGRITAMLRTVAELEEATDRIYRMVKLVQRKYKKDRDFLPEQHDQLRLICAEVGSILGLACRDAAAVVDHQTFEQGAVIEDRIDAMRKRHNKAAMQRMRTGADIATEMLYTEINNHLEAVGNHALNILETNRLPAAELVGQ